MRRSERFYELVDCSTSKFKAELALLAYTSAFCSVLFALFLLLPWNNHPSSFSHIVFGSIVNVETFFYPFRLMANLCPFRADGGSASTGCSEHQIKQKLNRLINLSFPTQKLMRAQRSGRKTVRKTPFSLPLKCQKLESLPITQMIRATSVLCVPLIECLLFLSFPYRKKSAHNKSLFRLMIRKRKQCMRCDVIQHSTKSEHNNSFHSLSRPHLNRNVMNVNCVVHYWILLDDRWNQKLS